MSHFIYRTEAIILGEMPSGEDNRLYFLLTDELGFVMAQATGVRLLKSKLRFHLSLFANVDVEMVRGKNIWRIVNVYGRESKVFFRTPHAVVFARLSGLVRRLVHGEEDNKKLFNEVKGARAVLSENNLSPEEEANLELVSVARILETLGYFSAGRYEPILAGAMSRDTASMVIPFRRELTRDINEALKESQL
ncbi:MAG: recombination protein O N-terminal domain-containing protein [Candidatus Paceibacterota bacterium]|jgi:recombinational DNA repair protein (RecF pathway)